MNHSNRLLAGLIIPLFLISAAANAAPLVIEQPLMEFFEPFVVESSFDDQGAGPESADNFATTVPFDLETVSWWGSYTDFSEPSEPFGIPIVDPNDAPPDDTFDIRVYADAGGQPNIIPIAGYFGVTANRTPNTPLVFDIGGALVFEYSFALPSALSLAPGDYWLSVVNLATDVDSPVWFWAEADAPGGDLTNAVRDFFPPPDVPGPWQVIEFDIDLAYRLEGTTPDIPVVPPLLLMAAPALLLIARRRR